MNRSDAAHPRPDEQTAPLRARRLRSHRLTAPAATVADAARHMLAIQSQDFGSGRWALAVRTRGEPSVRDLDAAFDRGDIVRSWTMRGTIHTVPSEDLSWVLSLTGERQARQAAAVRRREGLDDVELRRAERVTRQALCGDGRLSRDELFALWQGAGIETAGQRGYHLLVALSLRGVVCQGPVVARADGPTREQHIVLVDEWIEQATAPADPIAELFVRYIASHGPAGVRDFAWWSGLALRDARHAAEAAGDRVVQVTDGVHPHYAAARMPRRSRPDDVVVALPAFDEYYLSYADRTLACAPAFLTAVGPGKNGMVRPVLVRDGAVVGVWTHSLAVGRHRDPPRPETFVPADDGDVVAALDRYRAFVSV